MAILILGQVLARLNLGKLRIPLWEQLNGKVLFFWHTGAYFAQGW